MALLISGYKPQKLLIQFGGKLDYHFSLSQSDLRWRMRVIWRSWMLLILTCFILLKGPSVTMNLRKGIFFLFCWQWKLFIQIISCQQSFFASDKMKTTSFLVFNWIRAIYENFQKNGGMEWHSDFTVLQYRMRLSR